MAAASSSTALISAALPEKGATRLATQFLLAVVGSLLLIASAKTKVVLGPVDMSLQTLAVLGIGAAYGLRLGLATLLLYMAQGAMGYPVFQSTPEKGIGIAYMLGSTGGYLLGFVAMAAIVGWAVDRGWGRSIVKMLGAMLVAEVVMMALGFSWLSLLIGVEKSWQFGVVPFIVPDLIKVALAAAAVPAIWALLPKRS
ncbi:biotin transporter BioY [Aminobacter aminovorans]|uniref:biotin transporter BioY n=1 Tax=Aminobacter aminovorans TaxID=83263 RepID=UPI002860358D|nr:biotin transporter BioY [Aminobacter aminovorans]MDR7222550.1 biotin transport system substrate-specific component [Aminobacter aminovorans]